MYNEITVKKYHCKSVDEFWDMLSPLNKCFEGHALYRGQADVRWPLVPTLLRDSGYFRNGLPEAIEPIEFIESEIRLLSYFLDSCDKSALSIPNDSMELRSIFTERGRLDLLNQIKSGIATWPYDYLLPILAFAQHFGVPTRLLDWTERSYVAAYFAASAYLSNNIESSEIAVWRLQKSSSLYEEKDYKLKIVRPPVGTNSNMAAQSGWFTVSQYRTTEIAHMVESTCISQNYDASQLSCFTLPTSECPTLLLRCSLFGIDAASLFPGFYGVAKNAVELFKIKAKNYIATVRMEL